MVSSLVIRNVTVAGRRTSMRLEPSMWDALGEICAREGKTVHQICTEISRARDGASLTSSLRVYIMRYFWAAATEDGHRQAGHGQITPSIGTMPKLTVFAQGC